MTPSVIQHESIDESGIGPHLALHGHDFDHVEIERRRIQIGRNDALNGVDDGIGDFVGEVMFQFGFEGGGGEAAEEFAISDDLISAVFIFVFFFVFDGVGGLGSVADFELVEELNGGVAGDVEAVGNDAGVEALGGVAVGLFEEFAAEEDGRGGAVSGDFILTLLGRWNKGLVELILFLKMKNDN